MSQWAGGVLTAAGRALQAKVEAGTTALVLTKIKLGDGTESMDAVDNLTNLVGPKAVLGISSALADGDHATITGVVLSSQLQAGFWCREWGLFARDPDAGEILYMITIDNQPEWIPASTAAAQVSATYAMNVAVANATNIEVQIDPAGLVDIEMLQKLIGFSERSKAYSVGDTSMVEGLPAMYYLECTTAGTSGASAPVIQGTPSVGDTITDGTVVWTVRKSASSTELTNHNDNASAHANLLSGTSFGTAVVNHLLGSALASLVSAVSTDSLFSKLLKKALEAAGLQYSMGTNGYICFGALFGNLILQWGSFGNDSSTTTFFPIAFSSKVRIVATPQDNTRNGVSVTVHDVSTTSFVCEITNNAGIAKNVNWIAIGY